MNALSISEVHDHLRSKKRFDFHESFSISRSCAELLAAEATEAAGRDLIIRMLDAHDRLPLKTRCIWNDLVEAAGLHPYVDRSMLSTSTALRHETHESSSLENTYLHREQLRVSSLLRSGKSVVVSAPTSFGKSLLIEEVVASKKYRNIVVVQPTLALLDETRKKLRKYESSYSIVVSTHQEPSLESNIFLFTAERVVEYEKLPRIDFFVIDEFYKLSLSRDDERAITLNQALYLLLKSTDKFYFLGPNIRNVSDAFIKSRGATWIRSDYATVAVDVERRHAGKKWKARDVRRTEDLYSLLDSLSEPTLIYCSSPDKAATLAADYAASLPSASRSEKVAASGSNREIVDWVSNNVHAEWSLTDTLPHGIAFHHGQLPRHLGSALIDSFNSGATRHLFCTSTLIEGVNTTARNVVLFDQHKGRKPIDFFDYKNIVGRSGRMKIHYVGKVYEFHREPTQEELNVDVPLFDQDNAPMELLIQLDRDDLTQDSRRRIDLLEVRDETFKALIKRNSGISVAGQIELERFLDLAMGRLHGHLKWNSIPSYEQLSVVLDLCWKFFLKPNESKGGVRSAAQLATMTLQYCKLKALNALIAGNLESNYWKSTVPEYKVRVQKVVGSVLGAARNWFEFKLPKHLAAFSSIQEYVCERKGLIPGNYGYLAALLENSFVKKSASVLMDYDVPASAIRKVEALFRADDPWESVRVALRARDLSKFGLLPYELKKLKAALNIQ
jgi:late competence protein required for DNA uptake (superfamily II DNA/RNA helicase)